ncbi:hypothetical protein [Clostridium massiliamazoniense]|uniref:hypothetical protein n=1 Tax=Clostridium massiliamazoniense TaxID=1347366 RepID=UPI0006D7E947|nr:hypothetical protein [Clostridium massiliamazoniense]
MLNVDRLFKAGRETKIFEVVDKLSVNDFYNNTGYQDVTSIHEKMSRIKLVIVDISKGKGPSASVGEFNLKASEWNQHMRTLLNLQRFLSLYPKKILSISKANPYKKFENDFIEVKHLKISYQDGLRVGVRWKFEIITGRAKAMSDGFGYENKTFQKINNVDFLLSPEELESMITYITKYISLWEQSSFNEFMLNKKEFIKRCCENNYDEKTIKEWNKNPNSYRDNSFRGNTSNSNPSETIRNVNSNVKRDMATQSSYSSQVSVNLNQAQGQKVGNLQKSQLTCESCGCEVTLSIASTTKKQFGKALCETCLVKEIYKK